MQWLQRFSVSHRLGGLVIFATLGILAMTLGLSFSERNMLIQERQTSVRQTVEVAHGLLVQWHALAEKGHISHAEAQKSAMQSIAQLRYSGTEYFWINDMHPRMLMHPARPQLDGQDVSSHKDPTGRSLFVDFVNIVKQQGAGYHTYLWPMPGSDEPVEKVSYIMGFQPWGWVIGSGVYIDTVHAAFMQRLKWAALSMLALLALLQVVGWVMARSILQQLGAEPTVLLQATERMAEGDLSLTSDLPLDHNPHSVTYGLENMRFHVANIVQDVRNGAESVAATTLTLKQGNLDLAGRTEAQASALEQTAAAMEQLGATVRQNAENARQANQLASNASQIAQQGGQVVEAVVHTMREINTSSQRIADIIGVIDSIAFQTNILALNAAVEAARAGEQGRGFAVVASEVRSLAGRSAEAAKEIKSLIEASVERVHQGSAQADQAGATMAEVVQAIRSVNVVVGEISTASAEQSTGVGQVAAAISQMDQNTQHNAALVEHSATAAAGLQAQAEQLVHAVSAFRLSHPGKPYPNEVAPQRKPAAPHAAPVAHTSNTSSPALAPAQLAPAARTPAGHTPLRPHGAKATQSLEVHS